MSHLITRCAALALVLFLASCAAPVGRLNHTAVVPYLICVRAEMGPNVAGLCNGEWIKEAYCDASSPVPAHECAHLADLRGVSYRQAIALLTPVGVPNEHMARRLACMQRIADRGGDYWQAIKDVYGADGVQHPEILALLK